MWPAGTTFSSPVRSETSSGLRNGAGNEHARANQRLLIGPWYHIPWRVLGDVRSDEASPHAFDEWQLAWFDRAPEGTAGRRMPMRQCASTFCGGELARFRRLATTGYDADRRTFSIQKAAPIRCSGMARWTRSSAWNELPDVYTYDPVGPHPGHGGHSCCFEDVAPMGPADQYHREVNNGVLVYTSAPLEEPIWSDRRVSCDDLCGDDRSRYRLRRTALRCRSQTVFRPTSRKGSCAPAIRDSLSNPDPARTGRDLPI